MYVVLGLVFALLVWSQSPVRRVPVIITYEVTDGIQRTWRETHYYRSDGSMAHTMPSPGDTAPPQMEVVVEGQPKRSFAIDHLTKLYIEFPLSVRAQRLLRVATSCESATIPAEKCSPLGTDEILGYRVQKATSVPLNRPKTVYETYLAPDLNFVPLLRLTNNGERVTYRQTAISVDTKEPDDTVFAIPDDYRKVSEMSEFYGAGELARGR